MSLRFVACAVSMSVLAGSALAQGSLFPVSYLYSAVDAPYGSALADVNGDGYLDCLVANYYTDKVSVYFGTGTGALVPQTPLVVGGSAPRSLIVADLNGDTQLDLATANSSSNSVSVLLGNGLGSFGAPVVFPTGAFPVAIAAGDVDNDGDLDIVTGNQSSHSLSVLLGNGAGVFAAPITQTAGASPERIQLADFDGDGKLDCAAACWLDDRVTVSLGDGLGHLSLTTSLFTPSPKGLAVGDVTGDGLPDVLTASSQYDTVFLFRALGGGGLAAPKSYYLGSYAGSTTHYPTALALADANGDGLADLIVGTATQSSLQVWVGVGTGNYFEYAHTSSIAEPAYDIVAGDLNGDGFADVVTSNLTADTIRAHISAGFGSWQHYCTAKVNSLGCTPTIQAFGTPSISNVRPFYVTVSNVLDSKLGIFIYRVNGAHASTPFHGGTLCVGPSPIRRSIVQMAGGDPKVPSPNCTGTYALHFNAFAQGFLGGSPDPALLVLGNSYQVQMWSRDPGFAPPNDIGLTAALDVTTWL